MAITRRIAVIGAGAFGGWTALELARRGADVTLIDAWGPGHVRASSGGETRVLRATYGSRSHYTALTVRALARWREFEKRVGRRIFHRTGVLWMFGTGTDAQEFAAASAAALAAHGVALDELTMADAARHYPQIDVSDLSLAFVEREAGYLMARRACEDVVEVFRDEGGRYLVAAAAAPVDVDRTQASGLMLTDGTTIAADAFVFACGPWLGSLFPDAIGRTILATRQEVYYFGTPAGDRRFVEPAMPVWIEFAGHQMYGIPGNAHRGFKVADDAAGDEIDPTSAARDVTASGVTIARTFLARRFPSLRSAPLVGSEVCQYEATPDSDFIVDRHPRAGNVWIAGGGSGHGFKMGPAVGEMMASLVLGGGPVDPRFSLKRFAASPATGWQPKWT